MRALLTYAWRDVRRHPVPSGLGLVVLALAIAFAVVAVRFVDAELSFDRHHEKSDRIYRVAQRVGLGTIGVVEYAQLPGPAGERLAADFDQVESVRFYAPFNQVPVLRTETRTDYEERFYFADPSVFDVFSYPLRAGDPETALTEAHSVVLTASMAEKYFGDADPMGQTVQFENAIDFTVTGVMDDLPPTTHLPVDVLASMSSRPEVFAAANLPAEWLTNWVWNPYYTYVAFPDRASAEAFERDQLPGFVENYLAFEGGAVEYFLQPLPDIWLTSDLDGEALTNGDWTTMYAMGGAALLLLVLAGLSFVYVTSSRPAPVVPGATQSEIRKMLHLESLWIGAAAVGLGAALAVPGEGVLEALLDRTVVSDSLPLIAAGLAALVPLIGVGLGALPALRLAARAVAASDVSDADTADADTADADTADADTADAADPSGERTPMAWRLMLGGQVGLTVACIAALLVAGAQLRMIETWDFGFDADRLVSLQTRGNAEAQANVLDLKAALLDVDGVEGVTRSSAVPLMDNYATMRFRAEDRFYNTDAAVFMTDGDFIETLGLSMHQGTGYAAASLPSDLMPYLINEELARQLEWEPESALNRQFAVLDVFGVVTGLVNDFTFETLHRRVIPVAMLPFPQEAGFLILRVDDAASRAEVMREVESVWNRFSPDRPMRHVALHEHVAASYAADYRFVSFLGIVTLLVALITLASLTAFVRRPDVAPPRARFDVSQVRALALGTVAVALPLVYVAMTSWLDATFYYHVHLSMGLFGTLAVLAAAAGVWFALRARGPAALAPAP